MALSLNVSNGFMHQFSKKVYLFIHRRSPGLPGANPIQHKQIKFMSLIIDRG